MNVAVHVPSIGLGVVKLKPSEGWFTAISPWDE